MSRFADVCDSLQCQLLEYPEQADAVISTAIELLSSVLEWNDTEIIEVLDHCNSEKHNEVFNKYLTRLKLNSSLSFCSEVSL